MVEQLPHADAIDPVSLVFAALADPTRRSILAALAQQGSARVTDLAQPFRMSLQAVSKHLKKLERAGLIKRDVQGRVHRCSMDPTTLRLAASWIEEQTKFWQNRFDALGKYLEEYDESRDKMRDEPDDDSL